MARRSRCSCSRTNIEVLKEKHVAIAIALSAVLVCATLAWCTLAIISAIEAGDEPAEAPTVESTPSPGVAELPTPEAKATVAAEVAGTSTPEDEGTVLTQAEFSEAWHREHRAIAERECFAPVDARGEAIEPKPYFQVTVAADGRVESVTFDKGREELFGGLFACVAEQVSRVVFNPGERRSGFVQAERMPQE